MRRDTGRRAGLIEEARAHARRRRRRTLLAVIIIAAAIGGGLAGADALSGKRTTSYSAPSQTDSLTAHTGAVTGYIQPCEGLPIRLPYAAGTVTAALRGRETWKLVGSESNRTYQTYRLVLPTTVTAWQHVRENQKFSFNLPPGRYVLVGRYDNSGTTTYLDVTIATGKVLHRDLPNTCK